MVEFQSGLEHSLRIHTPDSDKTLFDHWQNNHYDGASPEHYIFHMFNITNMGDVINKGMVPEVTEHGPYSFRMYTDRFNITFMDNNQHASYNMKTTYYWDPDLSCEGCSPDDVFVNLWPTYVTLLKQAGGFTNGAGMLASPMVNLTMTTLLKAASLSNACSSKKLCEELVVSHWMEGTGIPNFIPSGSSMASSDAFLSFLKEHNYKEFARVLSFLESKSQLPEFAFSQFRSKSNITTLELYDWAFNATRNDYFCQFGAQTNPADPTTGCVTYFLETWLSGKSEKYFPLGGGNDPSELGSHLIGLGSASLGALAEAAGSLYPLEGQPPVYGVGGGAYKASTVKHWIFDFEDPFLRLNAEATGQAFSLAPGELRRQLNTAYFANRNHSSIAESWETSHFVTKVTTGSDLNSIDSEVEYQSLTELPIYDPKTNTGYFCGGTSPVYGRSDRQPFAPGRAGWFQWHSHVDIDEHPKVWVDETLRPLFFQFREDLTYRGIKVKRFEVADEEFRRIPRFDQIIPGLLDMTCPNHGTPIMLTMPHYAKAKINASLRVDGMTPVIPDKHLCFLDVDPVTGSTLAGYERLQINLYAQPEWLASANVKDQIKYPKLVPAFWVEDSARMSDDDEKTYKSQVLGLLNFRSAFLITCVSFGIFFFLVAAPISYFWYLRESADEKESEENFGNGNYEKLETKAV